jgi:hypothetical protein
MKAVIVEQGNHQKLRAIHAALLENFKDITKARHYFEVWLKKHASETCFIAPRFAATVSEAEGYTPDEKSKLLRSLYGYLSKPFEQLMPYPEEWLLAQSVQEAIVAAPVERSATIFSFAENVQPLPKPSLQEVEETPARIVFRELAAVLSEAVLSKTDRHGNLLEQVIDDLNGSLKNKNESLLKKFKTWSLVKFNVDSFPAIYSTHELRYFTHLLYLIAADVLGPTQADKLLNQAVGKAGRLPQATEFSPQSLL